MSNSLQPCGLQHARLPCPSLSPGVYSRLMSTESLMPSVPLMLCLPFSCPQSFLTSGSFFFFFNESALLIRLPKYRSFSISPSSEYSVLISLRIDWFDLLAVQGCQESSLALQFESISSLAYLVLSKY